MHVGADLPADISNRGFKRGIRQWLSLSFADSQPSRRGSLGLSTLVREVAMKQRPKVIGDRHAVFIAIPLKTDRNGPAPFVDVDEVHAEQAMSAGEIIPVAYALPCTE
jgi:hypothetical protein